LTKKGRGVKRFLCDGAGFSLGIGAQEEGTVANQENKKKEKTRATAVTKKGENPGSRSAKSL